MWILKKEKFKLAILLMAKYDDDDDNYVYSKKNWSIWWF